MVALVSPRGAATPFGTAPRIKPYKVSAIFEMGMSEYDRTMIFISREALSPAQAGRPLRRRPISLDPKTHLPSATKFFASLGLPIAARSLRVAGRYAGACSHLASDHGRGIATCAGKPECRGACHLERLVKDKFL